ncbi:hypothetical protein [Enterobacter kobei]|uniref:hypothetical protein n=1 Tax=Enterobacter kobei TaxID=208224 RepID=UPI001E3D2B19|nr:hypothetical protein [Enterobacter kobei]MCD0236431.1 hypothetical protein [Enterobacter kobei]
MMNAKELELKLSDALQREDVLKEKVAALESRCAALAAEVYDLKHPGTYLPSKRETPALDAFMAEVLAQGVDSAINTVIAMMNHQHPVTSKAIDILRVHAYQIRKGVQS